MKELPHELPEHVRQDIAERYHRWQDNFRVPRASRWSEGWTLIAVDGVTPKRTIRAFRKQRAREGKGATAGANGSVVLEGARGVAVYAFADIERVPAEQGLHGGLHAAVVLPAPRAGPLIEEVVSLGLPVLPRSHGRQARKPAA